MEKIKPDRDLHVYGNRFLNLRDQTLAFRFTLVTASLSDSPHDEKRDITKPQILFISSGPDGVLTWFKTFA